jgi:cbb3-type cytochrome oxidase subunit 3
MSFLNIAMGWFLGFMFGVGCALAVMYSIYRGGYRKAIEDSLEEPQPEEYTALVLKRKRARQ